MDFEVPVVPGHFAERVGERILRANYLATALAGNHGRVCPCPDSVLSKIALPCLAALANRFITLGETRPS